MSQSFVSRNLGATGLVRLGMGRQKVNAITPQFCVDLRRELQSAARDPSVRGVLLASDMAVFGAGLDLAEVSAAVDRGDREWIRELMYTHFCGLLMDMITMPKPIAAAVNGHALAGGLVIAAAADYVAVGNGKDVTVGLTEALVGVSFPRLPIAVCQAQYGPRALTRLVYEAAIVSGEEAVRLGAADVLSQNPEEDATKWLMKIASMPQVAFSNAKHYRWENVTRQPGSHTEQDLWLDSLEAAAPTLRNALEQAKKRQKAKRG
eukprot:TRINITY_DN99120_c0_g1_i1.p1 TRINITY_DN99120_c0_g1~~TRINITY_DN99120_c0_g1_i1.p1  ORF type:complete len:270 (+),score=40.87 TRINITY_DN99120_c0_g1_i1:24-812(+)